MAWVEHDHADGDALAAMVAWQLKDACLDAIVARGRALVALAGGRTPLPVYHRLAMHPVAWSKVTVMPTDERCVPHAHPACNLHEIDSALAAADGLTLEALTTADGDPARSLAHARTMLAKHDVPFDALVLGMGADGHVASLFPGAGHLASALDPAATFSVVRIDPEPLPAEAPFPRISLTVVRLLRARSIHLVISGAVKRAVLRQALAANDPLRYPIAAVLHAPGALTHIHWSP